MTGLLVLALCAFALPALEARVSPHIINGEYTFMFICLIILYLLIDEGGGDLVSIMPVCVCPKVKEMGSFPASSE